MKRNVKLVLKKFIDWINANILNLVSLKLTTVRTPNRDFREFFDHLKRNDIEPRTVIDIGVGNGTPTLYAGTPKAHFILIEPIPDVNGTLKKLKDRLGAELFNVAAGSKDGMITFNFHKDRTGSSSYDQVEGENALDATKIEVPVMQLDTLLADRTLARPSVLKIDTQGAELDVLRGATSILEQIDIIIVEASFHEFRKGIPEIAEVIAAFNRVGFVPYEILEGHYRYVDGALAQVDVVFVPNKSVLREFSGFFSADQLVAYNAGRL